MDLKLLLKNYFCILPFLFFNPFHILTTHASPNPYKLPDSLVPLNYFLQIRPIYHESHDESFPGQNQTAPAFIKITISCESPTNTIVLHKKFLKINESSIQVKQISTSSPNENELNSTIHEEEGSDVALVTSGDTVVVDYDEDKDFMAFNTTDTLTPGSIYEISMAFVAKIPYGGNIDGLYTIKYKPPFANLSEVGIRSMAVTSFEPVGARQVFPCFDEPIYKATWDIVIGKMKDFTVLSNGPLISTQPDEEHPNWFWDRFATTVKLPTYLVAFAVLSDFGFAEAPSSLYRLPVRVYGPKEWVFSTPHAQLVANFSAQLLSFYEGLFGVPFDMPKLDSLWIAKKREATECHGLILYGEQILIAEPDGTTDLGSIRFHLNLIAHEISHSWFGNMVGSSWTEVWLKEGMATLVSPWGLDAIKPEIGSATDHLIYETISTALHIDGGEQSHPLRNEALRKNEIDLNMDTLGYDKGAALGRMIKGMLGEEGFLEGLRVYLRRFQGSVATQEDLFGEMGRVGGVIIGDRDLGEVMRPWTEQKSYPVVRVRVKEGGSGVVVSQEVCENWEEREDREESENETVSWDIPVKYQLIKGLNVVEGWFWLNRGQTEREVNMTMPDGLGDDEDDEWVFLGNSDSSGYYRVLYEDDLAKRIVEQLNKNHSVFGASARARLLDDQLNLAFQRYIPIQDALEFTRYLGNERDPTVWNCVLQPLLQVLMLFRPTLNGLQTEEDFIQLKDTILLKFVQDFEDASNYSSATNDTLISDPASFSKLVEIVYLELSKLRAANGVNNENLYAFRNYFLPRIHSTLVDITTESHSPGSKNFSLTAEGLLESVLVDWSCSLNSEWCYSYSFSLKNDWAANNATSPRNPVPSDVQSKLYCQIVHWFGVPSFEWIYSQFKASTDITQQTLLSSALACSPPHDMSFNNLLSILMDYDETNTTLSKIGHNFVSTIYDRMMQHSEFGTVFMGLLLSFLEPSQYHDYLHLENGGEPKGFFGYLQNFLWTGFHLQLVENLVTGHPEYYEESLNGTIDAIVENSFWMDTFRENMTLWMRNATN